MALQVLTTQVTFDEVRGLNLAELIIYRNQLLNAIVEEAAADIGSFLLREWTLNLSAIYQGIEVHELENPSSRN